jgi:hypothetical protein
VILQQVSNGIAVRMAIMAMAMQTHAVAGWVLMYLIITR